ncbi:FabD/lysophospholipase-like protein [Venturia nashicola]|nr:FabD/lysophospholipase-like protein [Venturia nashicola]
MRTGGLIAILGGQRLRMRFETSHRDSIFQAVIDLGQAGAKRHPFESIRKRNRRVQAAANTIISNHAGISRQADPGECLLSPIDGQFRPDASQTSVQHCRKSWVVDDTAMLRSWDAQRTNDALQTRPPLTPRPSLPTIYLPLQDSDKDVTIRDAIIATMATDNNPKAKHLDPTHNLYKDGAELFNKKAPQGLQKQPDDLSGVALLTTVGAVMKPQPPKKPSFWKQVFLRKRSSYPTTSRNQYTEKIGDMCKVYGTQPFLFSMQGLAEIQPEDWSIDNIARVRSVAERYLTNERTVMNIRLLATNLVAFRRVREERMHLPVHERFPIHVGELAATIMDPPELDAITSVTTRLP